MSEEQNTQKNYKILMVIDPTTYLVASVSETDISPSTDLNKLVFAAIVGTHIKSTRNRLGIQILQHWFF
jgi:hypothetical protein